MQRTFLWVAMVYLCAVVLAHKLLLCMADRLPAVFTVLSFVHFCPVRCALPINNFCIANSKSDKANKCILSNFKIKIKTNLYLIFFNGINLVCNGTKPDTNGQNHHCVASQGNGGSEPRTLCGYQSTFTSRVLWLHTHLLPMCPTNARKI